MFVNWPCIATMVVAWDFIDSCVAAYAAAKFASDSLYDAIDALSSMAAMQEADFMLVREVSNSADMMILGWVGYY